MRVLPLSTLERQQGGFTHKIIITEADLTVTATATGQTLTIMTMGAGTLVRGAAMRLVTPFQDSADAASILTTIALGDAGSTTRYLGTTEMNVNGTEILFKAGTDTDFANITATDLIATIGATTTGKTL